MRFYPLVASISKHLLPMYVKPMILPAFDDHARWNSINVDCIGASPRTQETDALVSVPISGGLGPDLQFVPFVEGRDGPYRTRHVYGWLSVGLPLDVGIDRGTRC
jgi:hypothetical protein